MPTLDTLALFAAAAMIFAAVPGPAVFYIVTRSISQGRRAGAMSAAAVASGGLVHVLAATVGLSALLASSAVAFSVVKYLGAAYLLYLGVRTLLRGRSGPDELGMTDERPSRVFRQGVVVSILNPKTALFFLAFLPQFVDPSRGSATLQLAILGLVLVIVAATSDLCYAMVTGSAGAWLRGRARLWRGGQIATGGAYITLGAVAAISGERPRS